MGTATVEEGAARTGGAGPLRHVPTLALLLALPLAACSHDWSAGDAGDTSADLPDFGSDDGLAPDDGLVPDDGLTLDDGLTPDDGLAPDDGGGPEVDDAGPEDAPPEDAPPVECTSDAECSSSDPCTLGWCDTAVGVCVHEAVPDDTACGSEGICCAGACVGAWDVAHCGACGRACPGGPNGEPVCAASGCGMLCTAGFGDCDAAAPGCETETTGNEAFCGSCSVSCGDGDACVAGSCTPSWRPTSTAGAPVARRQHCGLWTGTELLVWGGHDGGSCFTSGGRYDPAADTWQPMAVAPAAVTGCHRFTAVWTGTEMIVWSGTSASGDITAEPGGGRYNPLTNTWALVSELGADPTPRIWPAAVWTGSQLLIWSGVEGRSSAATPDGARYNPSSDSWTTMSDFGAPPPSWSASVVWTGSEMIAWGGWSTGTGGAVSTGGRYNPATDSWAAVTTTGAPAARGFARAVWTGREMIVWGGATNGTVAGNPTGPLGDGAAYDPATDRWRPLAGTGAPAARFQNEMVWTGTRAIVWAGASSASIPAFGNGALYDPIADAWTPVTNVGAPSGRRAGASAWTGSEMVVWSGGSYDPATGTTVCTTTGGRYRPR